MSDYLVLVEGANCKNVSIQSDLMFENQSAFKVVGALSDKIFEDIEGKSFKQFDQEKSLGLSSYPLRKGKKSFWLEKSSDFPFKLMVLNYLRNGPETLIFKVNGQSYNLKLTNKSWGWNTVTVEHASNDEKVNIQLLPVDGSSAFVSKIVLVPIKVTD